MSKLKINEGNLKHLFGKNKITLNQKKMYNKLSDEKGEIDQEDIEKFFPEKSKTIKKITNMKFRKKGRKLTKVKRKGCGCK